MQKNNENNGNKNTFLSMNLLFSAEKAKITKNFSKIHIFKPNVFIVE